MQPFLVPKFVITNDEFEREILNRYGFSFSVGGATGQNSPLEFHVDGLFRTLAWQDRADAVRRGGRTRDVGLLLNTLCADGFLCWGTYLIRESVPVVSGSVRISC